MRRKMLVRAVSLFMVGLITAFALVIPTSAIMTEYPTLDNYTTYDCVMPFNVNFIGTDGTLDYVYSVPVGYNSPTEQTGIQGHDTLTGRVLGGDGITTNNSTLEYYYYPTEWRNVNEDGWGGVPVKLRIDNTELDGKTIVIEAPTFYVNPLTSNWYYASDPTTYNKWAMGAFRMPTLEDPTTQAYVGRYTVYANIVDDVGTKHPVAYSKTFDTRVNNNWISFLEPSIFQEYVINDIQETGYNRIVAVTDFRAFVDYDYYEYVPTIVENTFVLRYDRSDDGVETNTTNTFTYEVGMTWGDFIESSYNTDNMITYNPSNNYVFALYNGTPLLISDRQWDVDGDILTTDYIDQPVYYCASVITGGGGSNDLGDNYMSSTLSIDGAIPVTLATDGEWELVENSPLKATGIDVSFPVYERDFEVGDLNLAYPDFTRYISKFRGVGNIDVNADFTGWIATATSGFLNFELFPNFSIGGVLAILVGFSLVILFLKIFAGG